MDIRLIGDMDGIETAEKITEQFDIPIIYLTAHGDEETLSRAKITQPFGYIIKPFNEQELRILIEISLYKHKFDLKIKENAQWLSIILNSIGDGVIVTDMNGNVTFLNPSAEKITGWSLTEAINQPITSVFNLIHETTQDSLNNFLIEVIKSGEFTKLPELTSLITKTGALVSISDSLSPIANTRGIRFVKNSLKELTGTVLVFRDNTEQKLAQQQLRHQAFYDSLTNLPNRSWFLERLTDAIERTKRNHEYLFAVLFLDLDRFKIINDSLGHWAGDEILIIVGNRLLKLARPMDTIARLGGDEFAILLENVANIHEVCKFAQRVQKELSISCQIKDNKIFTNASIGIVFSSIDYETIEDIIQYADIAMYRAKEQGQGHYAVFDNSMRQEVINLLILENELRRALEDNEFDVSYQPIISLSDKKIAGFEALVCWRHPQKGLLSAAHFINIAEQTDLILEIDHFVLQKACNQLKAWQKIYPDAENWTVSVNLSGKQFLKPHLDQEILQTLHESGLKANCLKLEMTEGILVENPEAITIIFSRLKELGITFALDDFGTGYSSLSYLYHFPFNTLKIDRSFVNRIDTDQSGLEIVRTIILLAKNLQLDVVAEGIENLPQITLLKDLYCEYGQGYLFAKPLSSSATISWIESYLSST